MRIGLNLLHTTPEIGSGGWNYIAGLVSALEESKSKNHYLAFVTSASECLVPRSINFERVMININPQSRVQRIAYENSWLQVYATRFKLDCMHWFANTQAWINTVPGFVTVYDLQPFRDLYKFSSTKRLYLRIMMSRTARCAHMLLPMSEATASELNLILSVERSRMIVIPPCVKPIFKPAQSHVVASFRLKNNLPEYFWLYVAHFYPHKNHVGLLYAYHRLKSAGFAPWPLVLRGDPRGSEDDIKRTIADLSLSSDVYFMPPVSEAELPVLFSAATALVYPSLYEGGGIPVVEAMASGLPVVASNIPSVQEFAGDAACYFSPEITESISNAMYSFQNDSQRRRACLLAGITRSRSFSPSQIGQKLASAYAITCTNRDNDLS